MWKWLVLLLVFSSCEKPVLPPPVDAGPVFVGTERHALGLNDVTWLLPLEPLDAASALPDAAALIPLASFTRLTTAEPVVRTERSWLRVVGVRFDLCDRAVVGPCADDAEASLRLVLQPMHGPPTRAEDIALHAFFPIPRADVPEVVDTLRALAAMQNVPTAAPLQPNTAVLSDLAYRAKFGALIGRYAKSERLTRLTLFGQETEHAAIVWIFRGEELQNGALQPITIANVDAGAQEVLLFGGDSYLVTPLADAPSGFARVVMETSFRNSTVPEQVDSVKSLLAVDNPLLHTSQTAMCVTCHVSTTLLAPRTLNSGIDAGAWPERFTSGAFDLTPLDAPNRGRTLRALGYFNELPFISQRVINESANVVDEIEARFPAP